MQYTVKLNNILHKDTELHKTNIGRNNGLKGFY